MLVIRTEQMELFRQAALASLENKAEPTGDGGMFSMPLRSRGLCATGHAPRRNVWCTVKCKESRRDSNVTDGANAPSGFEYKVVGKSATGDTITRNINPPHDVKIRKPLKGDTFPGEQIEDPPGGRPALTSQLKCP